MPITPNMEESAKGGPLDMTVPQLLKHWHDLRPDMPALVFNGTNPDYGVSSVLTFRDLFVLGSRMAHILKARGCRRDDAVLIFHKNCPERAVVEAACQLLGCFAITATCNEPDASDLAQQVKRFEASTIVMDLILHRKEWQTIRDISQLYDPVIGRIYSARMPHLYLVFHTLRIDEIETEEDFLYWLRNCCTEQYPGHLNIYPHQRCAALNTAIVLNQTHRLAVHTHRNMVAYSKIFMPRTHSPHPIYYNDMAFDTPQGHISISLCNPITRVLLDYFYGPPIFPEEATVATIRLNNCDIAVMPSKWTKNICSLYCQTQIHEQMGEGDVKMDKSEAVVQKLVFIGILGEATKSTVDEALKAAHLVMLNYANAELLLPSVTCVSSASALADSMVGIPIQPGVFVRIIDDDDKELIEGFTGYLQIRSPLMFQGYLNDPEANSLCWTPDGYFRTRDAGYMKNGYLYVVTRYTHMAYSGILKEERAAELGIGKCVTKQDEWPF